MSRKLAKEELEKISHKSREVAELLIRGGRAYIQSVTAPNRDENMRAEERFSNALRDLIVLVIESD